MAGLLGQEQTKGKKVILCHGVFDLLHIGHIRHFEEAKKRGDILAVTTTPDHFVNKGPGRPVFNEGLRAEAIASLDCVDYVAINQWPTAVETIHLLSPDYYVKGSDYSNPAEDRTGGIALEEAERGNSRRECCRGLYSGQSGKEGDFGMATSAVIS